MISLEQLQQAVEQKIISPQQKQQLLALSSTDSLPLNTEGDEQLRFIRSFGDVFISIGIVLVSLAFNFLEMQGIFYLIPILVLVATSEWLVRQRRMALPGIALFISSVFFISQAFGEDQLAAGLPSAMTIAAASLLYFWRYRVPFSFAGFTVAVIFACYHLLGLSPGDYGLLIGLAVFCVAMTFDMRDTQRNNRFSDTAFWLHLLASPLIVHGTMLPIIAMDLGAALTNTIIISMFLVFFAIALLVDRRAILVSSLIYLIGVLTQLLISDAIDIPNGGSLVFIGFGFLVIISGVYWYSFRSVVYGFLRGTAMANYLPSFEPK